MEMRPPPPPPPRIGAPGAAVGRDTAGTAHDRGGNPDAAARTATSAVVSRIRTVGGNHAVNVHIPSGDNLNGAAAIAAAARVTGTAAAAQSCGLIQRVIANAADRVAGTIPPVAAVPRAGAVVETATGAEALAPAQARAVADATGVNAAAASHGDVTGHGQV